MPIAISNTIKDYAIKAKYQVDTLGGRAIHIFNNEASPFVENTKTFTKNTATGLGIFIVALCLASTLIKSLANTVKNTKNNKEIDIKA